MAPILSSSRRRLALAGVLIGLVGLGGAIAARTLTGSARPETEGERNPYQLVLRGSGTEKLRASGFYGQRRFVPRGALALHVTTGEVEIDLFPQPIACSAWRPGTPTGLHFEIAISVTPASFNALQLGRPLQNVLFSWIVRQPGSTRFDEVTRGRVTLTAVDTDPGGYWHGRIAVPLGQSEGGKRQALRGTFAAAWCEP